MLCTGTVVTVGGSLCTANIRRSVPILPSMIIVCLVGRVRHVQKT